MSGGLHRLWKQQLVEDIGILKPQYPFKKEEEQRINILDVAAGSGDITFKIIDYQKENYTNPLSLDKKFDFTLFDINKEMLE